MNENNLAFICPTCKKVLEKAKLKNKGFEVVGFEDILDWPDFPHGDVSYNGWDDHPDEINSSAFVQCSFESILSRDEEKAWISVRIREVFLLKDICNIIPPRDGAGYLDSFRIIGNKYLFQHKEWRN